MSTPGFQLCVRNTVLGILLMAASSYAESGASSPSISDDAAIFRQHAKLKSELDEDADALDRDTGVLTLIRTVSFVSGDTTASQARQLAEAEAQSSDQPVAAILYVRGNRSAGIGTNAAFDAIVPAFELASLPSQGDDKNTVPAEQIADTYRRLHKLVRRYADKTQQADATNAPTDPRTAERWLLAAVLAISAAIVGTCALYSGSEKPAN